MVTWLRQIEVGPEAMPLAAFAAARDMPPLPADPLVAIRRDAWERMLAHLRPSPDEAGGVLVGSVWRDPATGQTLVDVVAALPALGAYGSPTYFRFTPAAWDAISRERDALHPDLLTVGWYHSHPGLGVFYSGIDRAAQRAFFARPWNVGIVVDPADGAFGLFLGPESEPLRRSHLVLYEPQPESAPPSGLPQPDRRSSLLRHPEPAFPRHPEPASPRHPEPAGEGSRSSGMPASSDRDPSFVRMTIEAARAPERAQPGSSAEMPPIALDEAAPSASWRSRAAWVILVLLAVAATLAAIARLTRRMHR
jgi:proteasome lid subunit RPN8/RPN11